MPNKITLLKLAIISPFRDTKGEKTKTGPKDYLKIAPAMMPIK